MKNPRAKRQVTIAASLRHASGMTGYPLTALQWAKGEGCPAIDSHSRVNIAEFKKWMAANESRMPKSSPKDQKVIEEVRKLRIANDAKEKLLLRADEVVASWSTQYAFIKKTLIQKLENEYPTAVAGLDVPQARIYGKRLVDEILAAIVKGE